MKLNRIELRRLIESVINEEENPGSKFATAEKKGEKNKIDAFKQKATQEFQKTYDWFVNTVFPAIEDDNYPIVSDQDYAIGIRKGNLEYLPKGVKFNTANEGVKFIIKKEDIKDIINFEPGLADRIEKGIYDTYDYISKLLSIDNPMPDTTFYSLTKLYNYLETTVDEFDLRVTMESEQPDEFKEEVAKAKKNNPPNGQANESLSRGSLYRRRYYGRY